MMTVKRITSLEAFREMIKESDDYVKYKGTKMVRGVEFAVAQHQNGKAHHYLYYPDGEIEDEPLVSVGTDGNFTVATRETDGQRVMVDDDGLHTEW